jgi:hypothetical protein
MAIQQLKTQTIHLLKKDWLLTIWEIIVYTGWFSCKRPQTIVYKNYVNEIMTWKFIHTYREQCKTGPAHNQWWKWSFTSKHTWRLIDNSLGPLARESPCISYVFGSIKYIDIVIGNKHILWQFQGKHRVLGKSLWWDRFILVGIWVFPTNILSKN